MYGTVWGSRVRHRTVWYYTILCCAIEGFLDLVRDIPILEGPSDPVTQ